MPMIKKEVLNMARTTIQGKRFEFLIGKIDDSLKELILKNQNLIYSIISKQWLFF